MRRAGRNWIRPYPPELARSVDLVNKLVQCVLGGGDINVYYFVGELSRQTARLDQREIRSGRLRDSYIRLKPISAKRVEISYGNVDPLRSNPNDALSQREILEDILDSGLLEDASKSFAVNIKERGVIHRIGDLRGVEGNERLQSTEYLYHYQTSSGDFTSVISRSLGLRGLLKKPTSLIREEIMQRGIIRNSSLLQNILKTMRGVLRTNWIVLSDGRSTIGWSCIDSQTMEHLHIRLTEPFWWQDTGIPVNIRITNGIIRSYNAQIYKLHKRGCFTAIRLPID